MSILGKKKKNLKQPFSVIAGVSKRHLNLFGFMHVPAAEIAIHMK